MFGWQVDKLLETVADKHGQIDGIANCIGTVALTKPLHITDESEYRKVMDNNVLTSFNIVKGAVRPRLGFITGSSQRSLST